MSAPRPTKLVPAFAFAIGCTFAVACSSPESSAHRATRARAEEFGVWMTNQRPRSLDEFASLANGDRSPVLLIEEDGVEWRVVVRLTDEVDESTWEESAGSDCWEYRAESGFVEPKPKAVSCPEGPRPTIPTTTTSTPASLGDGAPEKLRATLEALSPEERSDEHVVRAAVTEAFEGVPRVEVDVAVVRGISGVVVRAGGENGIGVDTCLMARTDPIETWHPAKVYLLPGEVGCYAGDAAVGALKRGPH